MSLLDKHKASEYTAEFAKLALEAHTADTSKTYQVCHRSHRKPI
jgi:hypothetical protein